MIACAQLTIRDETDNMIIASTLPSTPDEDALWLDTSITPNILKRWNGTEWVQVGAEPTGNDLIVGTQTTATGSWTGIANFSELRDGQQITYWLPYSGNGIATLTLTLADATTTDAIPCYYGGTTRITTQYQAGSILHLTYRTNITIYSTTIAAGWWADANYYTDTYDRIRISGSVKTKTAITSGRLVVGDSVGFYHLAAGVPFSITRPILFTANSTAANSYSSNLYLSYPYYVVRNNLASFTGDAYAICYLVGTLEDSTFIPAPSFFTTTVPTVEDGYTYISLGIMTSAQQMALFPEHPMFRFLDGEFKALAQIAYEARVDVAELQTELATAIEQTDAAIALKADRTVTDSLGNRLETAEATLTTQAGQISSVVSQSQTTTNTLNSLTIGGRNYILKSNNTVELNNTGETFTSVWMSPTPVMSDDFLQDCKGKSIVISYYAMCENLERATTGSWIGLQITYNTETPNSYVYNVMTVTTTLDSGTKPWSRYRLTTTIPAAATSVRATMLTVQNCKGLVRLRNPQVECGNRITDYRPAPEDIEQRMDTAESSIIQHASLISLKVNTSTYNIDKVYRSSTAPTGTLYASMLWLDMSLTPNILKRWTGSAWVAVGAQEVKSSGITIAPNNVAITTEQFLLQLLDPNNNENILMEMSANGNVGFKELYADEIISSAVPMAYHGPTTLYVDPSYSGSNPAYFRSLTDAVNSVNNRYLRANVDIYLPSSSTTVFEANGVHIQGITGPGRLRIYGYSACPLCAYITIKGCSSHILFQNVKLRESRPLIGGTSRNSYLIECRMNQYVEISGCTLDANGTTYDTVYAYVSRLHLVNTGFYNSLQGLEVYQGTGVVKNCMGSCSWAMVAYSGIIFASGTVPNGSRSSGDNGQVYASGVTVNYGTAIPPVSPDETTLQYATLTRSYRGGWRTDTLDVVQGVYSDYGYSSSLSWNYGCMWFGNLRNVLSGTTVKSATLTIHRKTGSGSFNARPVYLCAISNTGASGIPNITASYGVIGYIGRDETLSVNVPIALVQGLADGLYNGLCLYEPPYNFGSANWSDSYIRVSGTDNAANKPCLMAVFSGSTAWG